MSIKNFLAEPVGQVRVYPRIVKIESSDTYAKITSAGYLNGELQEGNQILPTDRVFIQYGASNTPNSSTLECTVSISSNIISLIPINNLFYFDVAVTYTALANGGTVTLWPGFSTRQYKIVFMQYNGLGGTAFGGPGDRYMRFTDGTTIWSSCTPTQLATPGNNFWGYTGTGSFPAPTGTTAFDTPSQPGANIYVIYNGGTTDYTSGTVNISGMVVPCG